MSPGFLKKGERRGFWVAFYDIILPVEMGQIPYSRLRTTVFIG